MYGRGEPGAAVFRIVVNSKFPDCPRNCERRALFQGPGITTGKLQPLAYVAGKVEIAATTRESGYPPMKRHFVCRARCFGKGSVP